MARFKLDDFYEQVRTTSSELEKLVTMINNIPRKSYADMMMEMNTFTVGPGSIREFSKELRTVSDGLIRYNAWLEKTQPPVSRPTSISSGNRNENT
jgi:hypothetical protein